MSDLTDNEAKKDLQFEYRLDAPPEKVWRAISIADYREKWLPAANFTDTEPLSSRSGEEVSFRMRDDDPPHLESVVTFRIDANADGGTTLRIVHALVDKRLERPLMAANGNARCNMRAA
ncbi:SRPBCC domain-containing protein [Hoeflea sp. TYP-13]|uniref:SRPBCC domain-containing protein n=1 Tax=Hoeflea sp. TYP-13 TaxID=3230023 RepID=UPI0034C5CACA